MKPSSHPLELLYPGSWNPTSSASRRNCIFFKSIPRNASSYDYHKLRTLKLHMVAHTLSYHQWQSCSCIGRSRTGSQASRSRKRPNKVQSRRYRRSQSTAYVHRGLSSPFAATRSSRPDVLNRGNAGGFGYRATTQATHRGQGSKRPATDTKNHDESESALRFPASSLSDSFPACHDRCLHRRCSLRPGQRNLSADSAALSNHSPHILSGQPFPAGNSRAWRNFRSSLDLRLAGPSMEREKIREKA